jgi:hypothetical protein
LALGTHCEAEKIMTPEQLIDKVARAIFDAAPFRDEAGPFEVQSRQYQDITRLYARAAIRVVLEEAAKVADAKPDEDHDPYDLAAHGNYRADVRGKFIAAQIRALMPKEPT